MREFFGPGWRLYCVPRGAMLILMLGGGDKSTQHADIARAIALASTLEDRAMSEKIRIADLPEFDITEHLEDDQAIAEYLTIVLEEDDPAAFAQALGTAARALGMTEIAKASGIAREALYKALRADAKPRFDTINRMCHALGVKLAAQTIKP